MVCCNVRFTVNDSYANFPVLLIGRQIHGLPPDVRFPHQPSSAKDSCLQQNSGNCSAIYSLEASFKIILNPSAGLSVKGKEY